MSTNLLATLTAAFGKEIVAQASPFLGEPEHGTETALRMLLPALLSGLAKHGSTIYGASELLKTLSGTDIDSGLPVNLDGLFAGGERTDALLALGPELVKGVFGDRAAPLLDAVASLSNIKASSAATLLYLVAPLVFGYLKELVRERGLDTAGLAHFFDDQKSGLRGKVDDRIVGALGLDSSFIEPPAATPKAAFRETDESATRGEGEAALSSRLWPWLALLAGLVVASTLFRNGRITEVAGSAPAPVASEAPAEALPEEAPLPARIYFAVGSSAIDDLGQQAISNAIFVIRTQALSVAITGYTDKTGNVSENIELAKQRALAVRAALIRAGVTENQIQMRPPLFATTGSGSDPEARRVEISPVD